MDKGSMVADSFRSEQECCAELALAWKHAKEGKGNHDEVDGYLFHRDKILGESIGQLVIPKCRRNEVLKLAHTSVFSSHMGPKKKLERIKYSFFWEGLRADVKKFCESRKECQLTRSVRVKDRSPITPVARPELPFQVVNMDLIGPIHLPSSKGHKYILCLVDQHTRWDEAMPMTSLSAKVLRMLEQFAVSRIVDIDILMQIWRNRVKQINFVLEWNFTIICRVGLMNEHMSYFPSFSDEWSRDLKTTKETPVVFKHRNSVHVEVPNKSDGWDYFFSSLEKAFASENVSDELKPKVLLCMLGDKVSNLLVNLGEKELKDYESLKQVMLKEYEPSPKIYLENFRKAKRNSDETFSQFTSRLTSMWLYYWKSYDGPVRAKWNDSEKRSFNGSWGKQPFGEKKSDNFSSRKNFDIGQVTEIKKFACFTCGSDKHFKRNCPKNKGVDNKRLNVNKVSTEGTELEDGTVAARVDLLGKVIPRRATEDKLSKLVKTSISVDGKLVHALLDSGTEITVIKKDFVPGISVEGASTIYLKGIFGPAVKCPLVYVPIGLVTGGQVNVVQQQVLCALAEVLIEDVLLPPDVLDMLGGAQREDN
ncbi:CCHC-type domain-containing protein [Trichonephila clavipes]|nr:CCHC-type domain-containing protein [Trichonephila clavipes]